MERLKKFYTKYKRSIIYLLVMLVVLSVISLITFAILMAAEVIYYDGGMRFNNELFASLRDSWIGWVIFVILQTVLSMLLCVIPGVSMAFIILSQQVIFDVPWHAFLLCFISVAIASFSMYAIGRFGGYRLCVKLLGEEDCKRSLGLLRDSGTVYFPIMMLFPMFPDEALTMIAGTIKMKLSWFVPSILVARGIGIATIVFGLSSIPFDKFTTVWHWIGFVLLVGGGVFLVFFLAARLNKKLESRSQSYDDGTNAAADASCAINEGCTATEGCAATEGCTATKDCAFVTNGAVTSDCADGRAQD